MSLRGFMPNYRLPVYLLLDCSRSMEGEPIEAVNKGLEIIFRLLMEDPEAYEKVHISVISFSSQVDKTPLVPIDQFQGLKLVARGTTNMGAAFEELHRSIQKELVLYTHINYGDWTPLVYLLTDGAPTDEFGNPSDNYVKPLNAIHDLKGNHRPLIVALGCGKKADLQMLHKVTPHVYMMENVSEEAIESFFRWVSATITLTSRSVGVSKDSSLTVPPPASIKPDQGELPGKEGNRR